ncbi:MAG: AIR synthase-related protein, partial [Bacteroidota bacterium]
MQKKLAQQINLTADDLQLIEQAIGRPANEVEQLFFACLKRDRFLLQQSNPTQGKQKKVIEFRGHKFLDIGHGQFCYLNAQAHTVPTGVAESEATITMIDTHRKLIALGVRPLAAWQAFGFGDIQRFNTQLAIKKTVAGVGAINHQLGISNLGGSLSFHNSLNQHVLTNTFSIGVTDKKSLDNRPQVKEGTSLLLISPLGFFNKDSESNQFLANPLAEKQLMEALLEMFQEELISAVYPLTDGGLAGALLDCTFENKLGAELSLDLISSTLEPARFLQFDFPASVLVLIDPVQEEAAERITNKQELSIWKLGSLQKTSQIAISDGAANILELDITSLTKFKPQPDWGKDSKKSDHKERRPRFNFKKSASSKSFVATAKKVLKDANTFDQTWLKVQLDATIQMTNIGQHKPNAASLIRLKGQHKILAFSCDVNPRYTQADPYYGALLSVAEAARNIIISGAIPIGTAVTMNFGDPSVGKVAWQIQQCLKAIQEASYKLQAPILNMDWSLGHQGISKQGPKSIAPMPVIGMLGLMPDQPVFTGIGFKEDGHLIYMIGTPHNDINASVYLTKLQYDAVTPTPIFDLDEEFHIQQHLRKLIRREMIASAHDIMDGGLFVTLLESAAVNGYGFSIETDTNFRKDAYLFGEHQSRVVISLKPEREDDLVNYLNA